MNVSTRVHRGRPSAGSGLSDAPSPVLPASKASSRQPEVAARYQTAARHPSAAAITSISPPPATTGNARDHPAARHTPRSPPVGYRRRQRRRRDRRPRPAVPGARLPRGHRHHASPPPPPASTSPPGQAAASPGRRCRGCSGSGPRHAGHRSPGRSPATPGSSRWPPQTAAAPR